MAAAASRTAYLRNQNLSNKRSKIIMMKLTLCILALAGAFAAHCQASAQDFPIKIEKAWVRAVPPVSEDTAAYMILINTGKEPLKFTGGSTSIAKMVHPMITTKRLENGKEVFGMDVVDGITIPAGGRAILKPRGDHLMLMGLTRPLKAGETVKITLRFDPGAREIALSLPVAAMQPE